MRRTFLFSFGETFRAASRLAAAIHLTWVAGFLFAAACGDDTVTRRDAGEPCGEIGENCCPGRTKCAESGSSCDDDTCCAELQGATCRSNNDCCDEDAVCDSRTCCFPEGERCDDSEDCCDGLECDDTTGRCGDPYSDCGFLGDPCDCPGNSCTNGLVCLDNRCTECGDEGDLCCNGECNAGNRCVNELCEDCGEDREPCCRDPSRPCNSGLMCDDRTDECERDVDDDCRNISTCGSCVDIDGCGWCSSGVPGEECRLSRGSCSSGSYIPTGGRCP